MTSACAADAPCMFPAVSPCTGSTDFLATVSTTAASRFFYCNHGNPHYQHTPTPCDITVELTNQDPLATVSVQSLPTTTTAQYRPITVPVSFRHVPERERGEQIFLHQHQPPPPLLLLLLLLQQLLLPLLGGNCEVSISVDPLGKYLPSLTFFKAACPSPLHPCVHTCFVQPQMFCMSSKFCSALLKVN